MDAAALIGLTGPPGPGLAWGLGGSTLLAAGTVAGTAVLRRSVQPALALTGGLLVAMAVLDVLPDAVRAARSGGAGQPAVLAVAGLAAALLWFAGRGVCGGARPVSRRRPTSYAAGCGFALHRLVEGTTLGLAATTEPRAAVLLAVALGLHGTCEGVSVSTCLTAAAVSRRSRILWLVLLCAMPFAGALWGLGHPLPPVATGLAMAAVGGAFLAAGAANLSAALERLGTLASAALAGAGAAVLLAMTLMAG
jgi:zinc transporter ZupT